MSLRWPFCTDESSAAEEKRLKLFYDGKDVDKTDGDPSIHQTFDSTVSSFPLHEVKKEDLKAAVVTGKFH